MASKVESSLDKIKGKWKVEPCRKSWLANLNPEHDGSLLFSGAEIWVPCARTRENPDIVITGLSEQERIEFEVAMHMQPGTLSPYNLKYWSDKNNIVKVPKTGLVLDCDSGNLKHKLWYKIMLSSHLVAKGKEDLAVNAMATLLMTSEEEEMRIDATIVNEKTKAYVKYSSMSLADKVNYLKVYQEGRFKVDNTTKPDLIDQVLGGVVDKTPTEFLSTFENPYYKDYILLEDLISKGIVTRKGGKFSITGGVELGLTKVQALNTLRSDEFQDTKVGLIAKLTAIK